MRFYVSILITVGLFHFSKGKSCPETIKPHLTRCDMYFKCVVLPTKITVWVPTNCETGLIYEQSLRMCVLPGDEWECNLGEQNLMKQDDDNIYGVNSLEVYSAPAKDKFAILKSDKTSENNVKPLVNDTDIISVENDSYESSGDGFSEENNYGMESKIDIDGMDLPNVSPVDENLSMHLQRLSQLIDGLKQTYQHKETDNSDLRPDQLNAFLAHYNIKSQFNSLDPTTFDGHKKLENGKINPEILKVVLEQQKQLTKKENMTLQAHSNYNYKTDPHFRYDHTPQENTNVVVSNYEPMKRYVLKDHDGYSNSQIVVNRPQGSVLLNIPSKEADSYSYSKNEPHISEETLKTVLELSKQMVENQNFRQILPQNSPFYNPVVQPIFYPIQLSDNYIKRFSTNINRDKDTENEDDSQYQKIQSVAYVSKQQNGQKPTTIIQNSVIPVSITSGSEHGIIHRPTGSTSTSTEKSAMIDIDRPDYHDSYGNKVNEYESFPPTYTKDQNNYLYENPSYSQPTTRKPSFGINNENNHYIFENKPDYNQIINPSTIRPELLDKETISSYYTPSPHLDSSNIHNAYKIEKYPTGPYSIYPNQLLMTNMMQPFNIQTSGTSASQFNNMPNNPDNIQKYQLNNQNLKPLMNNAFPNQINPSSVKIRPNSFLSNSIEEIDSSETQLTQSDSGNYNHSPIMTQQLTASNVEHDVNIDGTHKNDHLVNLGGNFISYDIYKNQLLPALGGGASSSITSSIELITCTVGVRQSNTSDCTKYYVCNPKNKNVLSYACPPYTAFNPDTRICDAKTYSVCNPEAIRDKYTILENRRIQIEALKALQDAKRIRDEALRAQSLANLIRLETQKVINNTLDNRNDLQNQNFFLNYGNAYGMAASSTTQSSMMAMDDAMFSSTTTTVKPGLISSIKRRIKYICRDGAKIPDQLSHLSYYVCFKSKDGVMHRHKMTCSPGLMFCGKSSVCTLPRRCKN